MGIYSSGTNDGITAADPYVFPVLGKPYKLPDKSANYCLYANKNTFITASVDSLSEKEQKKMEKWVIDRLGKKTNNGAKLITDGYFYKTLHISTTKAELFLNLDTKKYLKKGEDIFNLSIEGSIDNSILFKGEKKKVVNITWKIDNDIISLDVDFFYNPQIRNGIRMKTVMVESKSIGLLVNNYSPRSLEIKNNKNNISYYIFLLNKLNNASEVSDEDTNLQKKNELWTRHTR